MLKREDEVGCHFGFDMAPQVDAMGEQGGCERCSLWLSMHLGANQFVGSRSIDAISCAKTVRQLRIVLEMSGKAGACRVPVD